MRCSLASSACPTRTAARGARRAPGPSLLLSSSFPLLRSCPRGGRPCRPMLPRPRQPPPSLSSSGCVVGGSRPRRRRERGRSPRQRCRGSRTSSCAAPRAASRRGASWTGRIRHRLPRRSAQVGPAHGRQGHKRQQSRLNCVPPGTKLSEQLITLQGPRLAPPAASHAQHESAVDELPAASCPVIAYGVKPGKPRNQTAPNRHMSSDIIGVNQTNPTKPCHNGLV